MTRTNWRRARFGDVVERHIERCEDPATTGLSRYAKVEHFDLDSLRLRKWGDVSDGDLPPTFKFVFRRGMVLYPTRSPELRQYVRADFDGLVGEKTLVLKPIRPDLLLPEVLPFIVASDAFYRHCNSVAVGSVNAHVRWGDLAAYEFALPPLAEQRRVSVLLSASLNHFDALVECHAEAARALEAMLTFEFDAIKVSGPLQSVCLPIVRGIDSPGPHQPDGVPYVRIAEMTGEDGIVVERLLRTTKELADAHPQSRLDAGDIVVALRGVVGLPVWVPSAAMGANLSRGTARVSIGKMHNPTFFYWALRSPRVRQEVLRNCTGWKGEDLREITLGSLRELKVPLPSRAMQDAVSERIAALAGARDGLADRARLARLLLQRTVETAVTGEA